MRIEELIETLNKYDPKMQIKVEDDNHPDLAYDILKLTENNIVLIDGKKALILSVDFDSPSMFELPDEEEEE